MVAKPFSLSQEFVRDVYEVTQSKAVQALISELKDSQWNELRDFERGHGDFGDIVAKTTHTLLVELLAYQFASPVRWIETQRVLFQNHTFGRLIEIGPSATLTTMAKRTLKGFYKTHEWTLRCTAKEEDMDMLFCRVAKGDDFVSSSDFVRNMVMKEEEEEETKGSGTVVVETLPIQTSPIQTSPTQMSSTTTSSSQDVPRVTTTDIVRAMIASKLKISLEKVSKDSSIQRLVGGKSALQNEIVGDLSAEFECDIPEDGASMSVQELGTKLEQDSKIFKGRLGKSTSRVVSSILRSKMPPSLAVATKFKTFLGQKYFHGDTNEAENITRLADSTLLTVLSSPPSTRLSDDVKAREYVKRCVDMTVTRLGLSLPLRQQQQQQRHHSMMMKATTPLEPVPDVPISSMSFMEALITSKLKRRVENLGDTTLRDVCAGKSALMNEMVGDIGTEFELEDASDSGDTKISSIASSASYV